MSAFLEDDGDRATLDAEDVFDRVGGSLGHLRMKRSLEQITARGDTHHRRRAAVSAMAGVVAITALGAAVTFAQSGNAMHAVSTADGTTGVASATRMADPDWTVTASAGGGYLVEISALGDVARLNATLKSLGIELKLAEQPPTGSDTACPAAGGTAPPTTSSATTSTTSSATGTATATATTSTTADTSPAHSGTATSPTSTPSTPSTESSTATSPSTPSPTPTPMSFPVPGTSAEFTFTGLPKESAVSFTSTDHGSRASLGTMRISDECLPVFGTQS